MCIQSTYIIQLQQNTCRGPVQRLEHVKSHFLHFWCFILLYCCINRSGYSYIIICTYINASHAQDQSKTCLNVIIWCMHAISTDKQPTSSSGVLLQIRDLECINTTSIMIAPNLQTDPTRIESGGSKQFRMKLWESQKVQTSKITSAMPVAVSGWTLIQPDTISLTHLLHPQGKVQYRSLQQSILYSTYF